MNIVQRSFAGGELSPSLYPRTDTARYAFGLRSMRNSFTRRDGGSQNRGGTKHISFLRDSDSKARYIPFTLSDVEGYSVQFEEDHFRIFYQGAPLTVTANALANNILGISQAAQAVFTIGLAPNGAGWYDNGVEVYLTGIRGMEELNDQIYLMSDIDDMTMSFKLKHLDGTYVNTSALGAWISGGTVKHVAHGVHDYASDDLADIQFIQRKKKFSQIVDTSDNGVLAYLYMTHPDYPVMELPVGPWYESPGLGFGYSPSVAELTPDLISHVVTASLSAPTNGTFTYRYCLTAILENGEETPPIMVSTGTGSEYVITGVSKANPAVVTVTGISKNITGAVNNGSGLIRITIANHGYITGQKVTIASVGGVPNATGSWTITFVSSSTFDLVGSTFGGSYTSGGTSVATNMLNGDLIYITGVRGMREINGKYYTATLITGNTFSINADSTHWTTYTSAGAMYMASLVDISSAVPTQALPNVISGLTFPNIRDLRVTAYNIYLNSYGIFGFLGTTSISIFNDTGLTIDISVSPPEVIGLYAHSPAHTSLDQIYNDFPAVIGLIQQRLALGNFASDVESVLFSGVGRLESFTKSVPFVDSDAFLAQPSSRKRNIIRHIIDAGRALIFTSAGEFTVGDESGISSTDSPVEASGFGANSLTPIVIDGNAIFVQSKGSVIREIFFDFAKNGFRGNDLTTYSRHLFEGHEIVDWAYQSTPNEQIWAVRDDGVLLCLTYVREQEIIAWSRHDFENGIVENVCVVPEGDVDALYLGMKRNIDGVELRSYERMHDRAIDDIVDNVFLDGSRTYDGRNTSGTHTMDLSGGTTWANTETLTLTSSTAFFRAADVGNQIFLNQLDTDEFSPTYGEITEQIRFTITGFTSSTVVTGKSQKTVPTALRTSTANWARAIKRIVNLGHLEDEQVAVFADGYVVANPNNSALADAPTVNNGEITLTKCYSLIHVGRPVTSDIEFLDIDTADGQSMSDQNKLATGVILHLEKTRGGWVGPKNPDTDRRNTESDPLYGLVEFKPRNLDDDYGKPGLKTGKYELSILSEWNSRGGVFIRQVDPLPFSVLGASVLGLFPRQG